MHNTKYPPDAAMSSAKVYIGRWCLCAKLRILQHIRSLCTGNPPGELTTTASALAVCGLTLSKALYTLRGLHFLISQPLEHDRTRYMYDWDCGFR